MKTKHFYRHLLLAVAFAAGIMMAVPAIPAMAQQDQPNMQAALRSLYQARNQLNAASHNKGGHRQNAINLVNRAINEVQTGITYGRQHPGKKGHHQYRSEQQKRYEEQHRREQQRRYEEQHHHGPRATPTPYKHHHGPHPTPTPTPHAHHTPYPPQS